MPDFKVDINVKAIKICYNNIHAAHYKISILEATQLENLFTQFYDDFISYKKFKKDDFILIELPFGFIELKRNDLGVELVDSRLKKPRLRKGCLVKSKIALEMNGEQHYIFPNYYYRDAGDLKLFLRQAVNDLFKKKICDDCDIILIVFPYWVDVHMQDPGTIQGYLIKEIENKMGLDFI